MPICQQEDYAAEVSATCDVVLVYLSAVKEDLEGAGTVKAALHHVAKEPSCHAHHELLVFDLVVQIWILHPQSSKELVPKGNNTNHRQLCNQICLPQCCLQLQYNARGSSCFPPDEKPDDITLMGATG